MDGIIIINKEKNYTSHDVVAKVKKILNEKKVGHTGTLDPNATGVLPILLGKGTKLSKYLINHDKTYEVVLKLGTKTDTADGEGNIIDEKQIKKIEESELKRILHSFIGKQTQIPPMYSAIKINGKKLYEYARNKESVNIEPREIEIYNIELLKINNDEIYFKVECSKGTYIRTLCENIAESMDNIGYMKELKRTKVGNFEINDAITLDKLEDKNVISFEEFLKNKDKIILKSKELKPFLNGVKIKYMDLKEDYYRIYDEQNIFLGTGLIQKNILKRDIIVYNN